MLLLGLQLIAGTIDKEKVAKASKRTRLGDTSTVYVMVRY
jgi:hypothetical protein